MSGCFITFEGGEGAGKSTQIENLRRRLVDYGKRVVVTREPGGTIGAEIIRNVLLSGKARRYGSEAEALLFAAARADHIDALIRPEIEKGAWVLCDRFSDSTTVYQGEAGADPEYIRSLEKLAVAGMRPDLTVLIDVPADVGLARVGKRVAQTTGVTPDRFEMDAMETHERRRKMFLELASREPERIAVVDGANDLETVSDNIWSLVRERLFNESLDTTNALMEETTLEKKGHGEKAD